MLVANVVSLPADKASTVILFFLSFLFRYSSIDDVNTLLTSIGLDLNWSLLGLHETERSIVFYSCNPRFFCKCLQEDVVANYVSPLYSTHCLPTPLSFILQTLQIIPKNLREYRQVSFLLAEVMKGQTFSSPKICRPIPSS